MTTHLPNAVAVAITAVACVLDDFVPRFSYLVESPALRFLALICRRKQTLSDGIRCQTEMRAKCEWTDRRTNSIALPAPAPLSKAGAVHHVALVVALGKLLIYFIVNTINDALVCSQKRSRIKTPAGLSGGRKLVQ